MSEATDAARQAQLHHFEWHTTVLFQPRTGERGGRDVIGYTLEEQQRAFRHGIHGKFWCPLTDLVLRPQARATVVLWGLWRGGVFRIRLRRRWRFLRAELTPYGRMLAVEPPKPPSVPVTWCKWCGDVPYPHDHRDWWRTKGLAQADKLREADR